MGGLYGWLGVVPGIFLKELINHATPKYPDTSENPSKLAVILRIYKTPLRHTGFIHPSLLMVQWLILRDNQNRQGDGEPCDAPLTETAGCSNRDDTQW